MPIAIGTVEPARPEGHERRLAEPDAADRRDADDRQRGEREPIAATNHRSCARSTGRRRGSATTIDTTTAGAERRRCRRIITAGATARRAAASATARSRAGCRGPGRDAADQAASTTVPIVNAKQRQDEPRDAVPRRRVAVTRREDQREVEHAAPQQDATPASQPNQRAASAPVGAQRQRARSRRGREHRDRVAHPDEQHPPAHDVVGPTDHQQRTRARPRCGEDPDRDQAGRLELEGVLDDRDGIEDTQGDGR